MLEWCVIAVDMYASEGVNATAVAYVRAAQPEL
jgi:hypothetical protein